MHFHLLLFILPLALWANTGSGVLLEADERKAIVTTNSAQKGSSGFIVRQFGDDHSAIIANAVVTDVDPQNATAELKLSAYTGLRQNSLPSGKWLPQKGDRAILGFGYSRALIIAPTDEIYHALSARIPALQKIHPDEFAAYLSMQGHPSPTKEDFASFCTAVSAGLLYLYVEDTLVTADCKSMAMLEQTPLPLARKELKLPFYSRVEKIREGWWGEGSDTLETYDPHYLRLLAENNPDNKELYRFIKALGSDYKALGELFTQKEGQ